MAIPQEILNAVNALLAPYGASYSTQEELPETVTIKRASEMLGVSTRTIRRWVKRKILKAVKPEKQQSSRVLIKLSSIRAIL